MYDTEKRVELVKKRVHENIAGRSAAGSAGCLPCAQHCLPFACGNGAHNSRPDADHRPGNVQLYPAT